MYIRVRIILDLNEEDLLHKSKFQIEGSLLLPEYREKLYSSFAMCRT